MANTRICPRCGKENKAEWQKCYYCGIDMNMQQAQQTPPPNIQAPPPGMYQCKRCGMFISPAADKCVRCGEPVPKKDPNNVVVDTLCFLSLVVAYFLFFTSYWPVAYMVCLFWTTIYSCIYERMKKNPLYDVRGIKRNRNICCGALIVGSITLIGVVI